MSSAIRLSSGLRRMKGSYDIVRLKSKPSWISKTMWVRLYKAGLIPHFILSKTRIENLIVFNDDHGVHLFLRHLGGNNSISLELNNAKIGTGTTPPTDADIDLQTPTVTGILLSTRDIGSTTLNTTWFMSDEELPNGTYNEFGIFCGTQLFARSIISPSHTKGSNEDTLVSYDIEVDNSI